MDEMEIKSTGCIYNSRGVQCIEKNKCGKCGWNPAVEKERKKEANEFYNKYLKGVFE